ncbi:MAG: hypothetical protein Fur009_4670 [Candidatus Microgenomates bacterium]
MKITVDFGASYGQGFFGTKIFSLNLRQAIEEYDKKNQYIFYDFKNVKPKFFWNKIGLSLAELKNRSEVFLALNQSIPFYTNGKIISFSHGLSFYFYSQYYPKRDVDRLKNQLDEIVEKSDKIIVSSLKVKNEFLEIYNQNVAEKIIILPFGIPFDILKVKNKLKRKKYFLVVGGNQPVKNFSFIKKIFDKFNKKYKNYQLINADNIQRDQLINYYQQATALLTASYYESFNFPVVEALALGCPVIGLQSAVIPELKEFVNVAKNEDEFLKLMVDLPKKPTKKIIDQLKNKFSWKKYIYKLVKLYV